MRPTLSRRTALLVSFVALLLLAAAGCGRAEDVLVVASTTSLYDSGLLDEVVPAFEAAHPGTSVRIIATGSGQALELGRRGDADALLVHSPVDEARFMSDGHGALRETFMRNDYVLLGPAADPAGVRAAADVHDALRRIAMTRAQFVSRGDSSGTHRRELELWHGALSTAPERTEVGQGMAETLAIAAERGAYTLSDRATFLALRTALALNVVFEGGTELDNVYSVIVVRDARHPAASRQFLGWLRSADAVALIARFGEDRFGQAPFTPVQAGDTAAR
jgi:tungstate transport system substrate-binding protein